MKKSKQLVGSKRGERVQRIEFLGRMSNCCCTGDLGVMVLVLLLLLVVVLMVLLVQAGGQFLCEWKKVER